MKEEGETAPKGFDPSRRREAGFHPEPVTTEEGIRAFQMRVGSALQEDISPDYLVEPMVEGVSVEMHFHEGKLVRAVSPCGDDLEGEDVTANLKTLLSVPISLHSQKGNPPVPPLLTVWGVVYMERRAFESIDFSLLRLTPVSTPGEAATEALRAMDRRVPARLALDMFCYGAALEKPLSLFETQVELLLCMQQWGFRINRPQMKICKTLDEIIYQCRLLETVASGLPYGVSGFLIRVNPLPLQALLNRNPPGRGGVLLYKGR
jgi:DNA ligase (NAD+)